MSRLQVVDETVYRYIKSGKLRAIRIGGLWRVPSDALDEFLRRGRTAQHSTTERQPQNEVKELK
jgi:excisionase family DNA binding protein